MALVGLVFLVFILFICRRENLALGVVLTFVACSLALWRTVRRWRKRVVLDTLGLAIFVLFVQL